MAQHTQQHHRPARLFGSFALMATAAAVITMLSPGGLGRPGPTEVTDGASVSAYRSLTEAVGDAPGWVGHLLELSPEATLIVLGLLLLGVCWTALRRRDPYTVAGPVVEGPADEPDAFVQPDEPASAFQSPRPTGRSG
ncbi:hypothetical protein [Streptomyces globisporus]